MATTFTIDDEDDAADVADALDRAGIDYDEVIADDNDGDDDDE